MPELLERDGIKNSEGHAGYKRRVPEVWSKGIKRNYLVKDRYTIRFGSYSRLLKQYENPSRCKHSKTAPKAQRSNPKL